MIINFQYNSLYVLPADGTLPKPGMKMVAVDDWKRCFRLLTEGVGDIAVQSHNPRQLLDYLHSNFINVKAAGGIVVNAEGQMLLMQRNGRSDLPKGKVEPGETLAQAALRETAEETGLTAIELGPLLLKTYHIYDLYGGWHFKQTTWFAMRQTSKQAVVPQADEGITELHWLPAGQWREQLQTSYATMRIINTQLFDNLSVFNNG